MYCDGCGREVKPGERFCSSCGEAIAPAAMGTPVSRLGRHLHILGILWLVYSAFALFASAIVGIIAMTIFGPGSRLREAPNFPGGALFLHSLMTLIAIFLFFKAIAAVSAGFGLMNRQPWARSLAIVMSFIAMLSIPFGMALGIYTLWVLMSANAEGEYRAIAVSS
jgi:hypothetical protein